MAGFSKTIGLSFSPTFDGDPRLRLDTREPSPDDGSIVPNLPIERTDRQKKDLAEFEAQTKADRWLARTILTFPASIKDGKDLAETVVDALADDPNAFDGAFTRGGASLVEEALSVIAYRFPEAALALAELRILYLRFPTFRPEASWWKDKAASLQRRWIQSADKAEREGVIKEIEVLCEVKPEGPRETPPYEKKEPAPRFEKARKQFRAAVSARPQLAHDIDAAHRWLTDHLGQDEVADLQSFKRYLRGSKESGLDS